MGGHDGDPLETASHELSELLSSSRAPLLDAPRVGEPVGGGRGTRSSAGASSAPRDGPDNHRSQPALLGARELVPGGRAGRLAGVVGLDDQLGAAVGEREAAGRAIGAGGDGLVVHGDRSYVAHWLRRSQLATLRLRKIGPLTNHRGGSRLGARRDPCRRSRDASVVARGGAWDVAGPERIGRVGRCAARWRSREPHRT
jgi:hypothetical protein